MSLHFLLDGYNILKQIPAFRDLPLEEGRRVFLRWIEDSQPQGSVNNQVTVVFDGHPDHYGSFAMTAAGQAIPQGEIRVIFSEGCSADDQIKLMVEEDSHKKNCVVVSNDKDIYLYARALGAKVMSVKAFTAVGAGSKPARIISDGKYISLTRQEKINKELSGIWLKEKQ